MINSHGIVKSWNMSAETLHKRLPYVTSSILSNKTHIGGDKVGMGSLIARKRAFVLLMTQIELHFHGKASALC